MAAALPLILCNVAKAAEAQGSLVTPNRAAMAALVIGIAFFGAACAIALIYARKRARHAEQRAQRDLHALAHRLAKAEMIGRLDEQVILFWERPDAEPQDLTRDAPSRLECVPAELPRLLDFPGWLAEADAAELTRRIQAFRTRGEKFAQGAVTLSGISLEIEARAARGGLLLRLRSLSDQRAQSVKLADQLTRTVRELDALRAVLSEIPVPIWQRDGTGKLSWVNKAYAQAVEAADPQQALIQGRELLDQNVRAEAVETLGVQGAWQRQILTVANGKRRNYQVTARAHGLVEAACALDVADDKLASREVERITAAHQLTLDHLHTGVAIFGADRRLVYRNASWEKLWGLDPVFLDDRPEEGAILDRLREQRKLPEQADYKGWKAQHLEIYQALEPREAWWHLPDGRTLRVFTHPNPQGGITLVQENVTEMLDLKSRAAASERMQRETLDALTDAVAVFGPDARLRLTNPALLKMWRLPPEFVLHQPHVDEMIAKGREACADPAVWADLKQSVIAFGEERTALARRLESKDGAVIDVASVPLPDGATLMTFVDVTAAANVERALKERNEALEAATKLKNDFIQHMSYELRSPLTNIIGFAQLLTDPAIGPLNEKQQEYMSYIGTSSVALLALINDILDLATIDAGVMELDLAQINAREIIQSMADALRERAGEQGVTLEVLRRGPDPGTFTADARRVRQSLYNLLSNAIGFSSPGQTVELSAERNEAGEIVFIMADHGEGIAEEDMPYIFDKFVNRSRSGRHRGVGLGLSLVKSFVELHGGRIDINSKPGRGTTARLVFPPSAQDRSAQSAA